MTPEEVQARVDAVPMWHHTIDLGHGVRTPGISELVIPPEQLPEMTGRSVVDIGAWDGYYSFLAERLGASRVVALDHYVWGVDLHARDAYWRACTAASVMPDHERDLTDFWRPELPGRAGFDLARAVLGSSVEPVVGDIATMDLTPLGQFDVVLFLGVLYHLQEPLSALRRVRRLTGEVAVIETEAVDLGGPLDESLMEFRATGMGAGYDYGNWYVPTIGALTDLCRASGFTSVDVIVGPPARPPSPAPARRRRLWPRRLAPPPPRESSPRDVRRHYRALVHARP